MGQMQSGQMWIDQLVHALPLAEQDNRVKVYFAADKLVSPVTPLIGTTSLRLRP